MGIELRREALPRMSIDKFKRHSAPFKRLKNQNGETNDKNLNVVDFDKGLLLVVKWFIKEINH